MPIRVGVDYDGVVADTHGFVVRFLREEFDVDISRDDFGWADGRPSIDADLGFEVGGGFQAFAADPGYVAELDPLAGAPDALWRLADDPRFEVRLASHRPPAVHDAIADWFERHDLPGLDIPASIPERKATATPPFDVLVDDYHGHADVATRSGLLGVHLTAAWESGEPSHRETVRAPSWADAIDPILDHADR